MKRVWPLKRWTGGAYVVATVLWGCSGANEADSSQADPPQGQASSRGQQKSAAASGSTATAGTQGALERTLEAIPQAGRSGSAAQASAAPQPSQSGMEQSAMQPSAAGQGGHQATAVSAQVAGMHAAGSAGQDSTAASVSEPTCSSDSKELKAGTTRETIEVDGLNRTYWLKVPSGYNGSTPTALLLEFHGLGLDGQAMMDASVSGWGDLTERETIVHAYPDGIDSAWNVGPCCTRERSVDDVAFARAIVERVASQGCIDRKRVYASGYSNGGGMSHYLACQASDIFAAVAPGAFDLLEENKDACKPARPITVISFRGTEDPIVLAMPHESMPPTQLIGGYELPPIHFLGPEGTFELWANLDSCMGMPNTEADGCRTYDACAQGVEVTLCLKEGGGHDPPDAERAWQTLQRFTLP